MVGKGKPAEITVSVSVHVPKPHTPFQWAAMDDLDTVERKQGILRAAARPHRALKLKTHDARAGVLEAIFARGDRPLADVLERAWRNGARFDSWDDQLDLTAWKEALAKAARETDIPEGGTMQGYGVKFYPPGHRFAGQNERAFPAVFQVIEGKFALVYPKTVATAQPVLPLPASSPFAAR